MVLLPYRGHCLASSLLFPILSYRGHIFHPTAPMARKMAVFSQKVQRWCTNCFACTLTDILVIEAYLPPLDLLLAYKKQLANLRLLCSPPEINPTMASLAPSVQTTSLFHHALDIRALPVKTVVRRTDSP